MNNPGGNILEKGTSQPLAHYQTIASLTYDTILRKSYKNSREKVKIVLLKCLYTLWKSVVSISIMKATFSLPFTVLFPFYPTIISN
jgi:hypothetical protein